jgi:hypothetical protein
VEQVLLGLVGLVPVRLDEGLRFARRARPDLLDHHLPLEHVDAGTRQPPLFRVRPGKAGPKGLRHPAAMGVPEAGEHAARRGEPQAADELLAEEAERHRVEEEHPLAAEADDAATGLEAEQLPQVQVLGAHVSLLIEMSRRGSS